MHGVEGNTTTPALAHVEHCDSSLDCSNGETKVIDAVFIPGGLPMIIGSRWIEMIMRLN